MRRDRHERRRENERESEKKTQRNDAHSQQTPVINYWNGAVLQQADSDLKQIKHFETGNNNTHQMIIIVIMNKIEIRTERNTGKRKQWDFTKLGKKHKHKIAAIRSFSSVSQESAQAEWSPLFVHHSMFLYWFL